MAEGMTRLPCGCRMGTLDDAFVFQPHDLRCKYYLYVLDQMKEQRKPVEVVVIDD